jgi:cytochrome P450
MIAGHETTASTISWALYELARRPDFQNEVRDEIKATRAEASLRGDSELSVADLDSMKYLLALMKVRPVDHYMYLAVNTYPKFDTPRAGDAQIPSHSTLHAPCSRPRRYHSPRDASDDEDGRNHYRHSRK